MSLLRILMMQVLVASFLSGNVLSGVYQANRGTKYDVGVNTNYANNYPTQLMIQPNIRKPLVLN